MMVLGLGAKAPAFAEPPKLMEQALIAVFEVPELVRLTVQTTLAPDTVQLVTCADTWAEEVKLPKSPNTNPAMAIAAMRVMAMRMTVASTGEMAFLFLR